MSDIDRWRTIQSRSASTAFVYGVKSTKIYCRSNCPGRLARRANVAFYDTHSLAEAAGFRACKRCRPDQQTAADSNHPGEQYARRRAAAKAKAVMDRTGGTMAWKDIAVEVGFTPRYLFEAFKSAEGVTPGVYAGRLKEGASKESVVGRLPYGAVDGRADAESVIDSSIEQCHNPADDQFSLFGLDDIDAYLDSLGISQFESTNSQTFKASPMYQSTAPVLDSPLDTVNSDSTNTPPDEASLPAQRITAEDAETCLWDEWMNNAELEALNQELGQQQDLLGANDLDWWCTDRELRAT